LAPRVIPQGSMEAQVAYVNAIDRLVTDRMIRMVVPYVLRILPEGQERDAFIRHKEAQLSIKIEDMFPPEKRDELWVAFKGGLDEVANMIDNIERRKGDDWPFGLGSPSWADFVLCSAFIWFDVAGPEGAWALVSTWHDGRWGRLYEDCRLYMNVQ